MNDTPTIPPHVLAEADQRYANFNEHLSLLLASLRNDSKANAMSPAERFMAISHTTAVELGPDFAAELAAVAMMRLLEMEADRG